MQLNPALFELAPGEEQYGLNNLIYGSLTTRGMHAMVKVIQKILPNTANIEALDLGCGDGELIYHLAQYLPGSHWYGVELCASRVARQTRPVFIWTGDMLEENLRPYNLLHADNLCLEDAIAERLETKIVQEFQGLYITYRTPTTLSFLRKAHFLKTIATETTWTTHPIHYYLL